jgi:hypothetical protein
MDKSVMWLSIGVFSTIGSCIPMLWGAGIFDMSSIIFGGLGAILGIYVAFKLTQ